MPTLTPLSSLLSQDFLPESLHLENLTAGFFDDIDFKDHTVTGESPSKHEATHNLTLVFNKAIAFSFPGSELRLLLNPAVNGGSTTTEIGIEVYYKWNILLFIENFSINNVPTDLDSTLSTIQGIYNINLNSVLEKLVAKYEQASSTIQVPIQAVIDELNRFYSLAGTANEISFSGSLPSFEDIGNALSQAGIQLSQVVTDFNLAGIVSDPTSPVEVLGAVIKKGLYQLIQTLNGDYSLTGTPDELAYRTDFNFNDAVNSLVNIGKDAFQVIKDLVLDITASFSDMKQALFSFLTINVTGLPTSFEELFVPEIDATVEDVSLALEFPRSMLIPMDDEGNFLPEPSTAKLTFEVGTFTFSTQNGFDFDEVSTCELKKASVQETGITLEFSDCVIDFHDDSNIPQADADGRPLAFQGVFIDSAIITLPKFWQEDPSKPTSAVIEGDNLLIGSPGGISGVLSMKTDPSSPGDLLHLEVPGALNISLQDFDLTFAQNSLDQTNINGKLGIPFLTKADGSDSEMDVHVGIANGNYTIDVSNIPTLFLSGIELDLDDFSIVVQQNALNNFSLSGRLSFPVVEAQGGGKAWIDFTLNYANKQYAISVNTSGAPKLDLGGLEISLTGLAIAFDNNGIIAAETAITGTIDIPAFDVSLEVSIGFMENGFSIEAKVPQGADPIEVLNLEDFINVRLSGLSIGKEGSQWSFSFSGEIINKLSVPGLEKFVPKLIQIDQFDLSAANDILLNLNMEWPNGFRIDNIGAGGSMTIPVNQSFGNVLSMRAIQIDTVVGNTTDIKVGFLGTNFSLGPVSCTIDGIGLEASLQKKVNGNLGPLDVSLGFLPPKGIGIALETDIIRGGGYLFFDPDNNRYAGAVELSFMDSFSISAIGLLTTVLPDGTKGTSLLIIVTTKFPSPIPLGFNFYLWGVGGLIGLHRTADSDKLRQGVVTNSIDHVLFPENVISNISQIVSDLRALFPPKRDQFLIGPMAMISWNAPPLLNVELGLIIEFDDPFAIIILGVIKAGIPSQDAALIKLQVNFVGILNFDEGYLSFDAALFDSRIVSFTLEGSMALRLMWGDHSDFALSVGGFHPAYKAPSHLKFFDMKRLTISLMGGNPRLTLTSYFAVTTNTVQFGASIDFLFKVWKVKVVGWFGFDVLFQFDPFKFIAAVSAGLAVKWGKSTLFSISLAFQLSGPTPWNAKGTAKFKVLFFTVKAKFNKTWGEEKTLPMPDIKVLPLVLAALEDASNWKSEIPAAKAFDLVTLRSPDVDEEDIILAAHGTLTVSQKVVPLGITIQRFGNNRPSGETLFDISGIGLVNADGETPLAKSSVKEDFAPASFKDMEDKDKLSAPSFEKMRSGVKAAAMDELETTWGINRDVEYEVIVSDSKQEDPTLLAGNLTCYARPVPGTHIVAPELYTHFAKGGAVRNAQISKKKKAAALSHARKVSLQPETYHVVYAASLEESPVSSFPGGSKAEADEALRKKVAEDPSLRGKLLVVEKHKAVLALG